MKKIVTKKLNLLLLLAVVSTASWAQEFLPALNDNYMGINQASIQPAAIVDSRFKVDINLGGLNSDIYNNAVRFKSEGVINPFSIFTNQDWWEEYSYLSDKNGKDKSAFVNQTILGPSFLISINQKHAIGFTYKFRSIVNLDDISEPLARSIYTDWKINDQYPDIPTYWNKWYHDENIRAIHHVFADYGLSYATEIFNLGDHYMKTGITVKLLQGLGAAYLQADDFYYYFYKQDPEANDADYMSWNSPMAYSGVSENWGSSETGEFKFDWNYKFVAKPSVGLDIGLVYEFRPKYKDYRYDMDGKTDIERRDKNKYLVKVGVSVLDIGRLKYERIQNSTDFTAQFTPGYANSPNPVGITNWMDIEEVDFGFPPYVDYVDTIAARFPGGINSPGTSSVASEEKFTVKLPTAFSLQADVNIVAGLYINLTTFTSLNQSFSKTGNSHYMSNYSITPRYEHKWFSVMIPVQYNQFQKVNVGLGIRAAFIYFGINNLFSGLFNDPYGTNIYFGVKIPIWQDKPPADRDLDKVSDAVDACPVVPGIWEFRGCPDKDGDGIADADDLCPDDPGPKATSGCPDKDGDGIIDKYDECPSERGLAQFNGCPDSDGDGIPDRLDRCPDLSGIVAFNGCPDSDGDGIIDPEDLCPNQPGPLSTHGCPFKDSDGDGIKDEDDACPDLPGPKENNGCPYADTDKDGVLDKDDKCPLTPGDPNNFGCPIITKEDKEILQVAFENLEFETGKAVIRSSSFATLDKVADLLNKKTDWKLRISGHTDDVGNDNSNMKLSENRAKAVANYMQNKGIAPSRLVTEWYGETKPIADNTTPEGRAKNRRVNMEVIFE